MPEPGSIAAHLRRDLGTLESYAALIGVLIGAGIFRVTSDAWALTGPSVILGYLTLVPAILATAVPYVVFVSTPLGRLPGGEYTHISRTLGGHRLAFLGAWLKVISYLGALAYLSRATAEYIGTLVGARLGERGSIVVATACLVFFFFVHAAGVRWFGRIQVAMCVVLGVSIAVLVLPGLPAIDPVHYRPFFTGGPSGFAAALPPLFFAYAGFESLAHTAGEVRESTRRLPRVFIRGIVATTFIYLAMSTVAFGVLSGDELRRSTTPMADVAARYLPAWGASFVTLGAIFALTTSINTTMLVPSRLAIVLAEDGVAPRWLAAVSPRTGAPVRGLAVTLVLGLLLLWTGQVGLALNIAVFALVLLYVFHSATLWLLPRRNPALAAEVSAGLSPRLWRWAAGISIVTMGGLLVVQVVQDVGAMATTPLRSRLAAQGLTTIELAALWTVVGALIYRRPRGTRLPPDGRASKMPE